MSLVSNVQARYSTQRILELTNPDEPDATSVDATRLADAAADVEAEFLSSGIEYDDSDPQHVSVGVQGVVAVLLDRMGSIDAKDKLDRFTKSLDRLRMTTSNDAILPGTNTRTQATFPGENGQTLRPPFDDTRLGDVIPDPLQTTTSLSDEEG